MTTIIDQNAHRIYTSHRGRVVVVDDPPPAAASFPVAQPSIGGCGICQDKRPDPAKKMPPITKRALNFAKALAWWAADSFRTTDEAEYKRRLDICAACEWQSDGWCYECGCYLPAKASGAAWQCAIGKWDQKIIGEKIMLSDRIDIIVPSYLNEELTAACFRSIKQHTDPASYRILWMDNGSTDPSRVLAELSGVDHVHTVFASNQGFVAAINEGLRISTGKMVCLLNNDTIVSPRWLEKLKAALLSNDKLGIVGALTDYYRKSPFPAMDSHHCLSLHNSLLPSEAKDWDLEKINCELERRYAGQTAPITFVAFLCALIKREVIDKVGLLDPKFSMGLYDDADYNFWTREAGWTCELAIDTCIYHRGRSTFSILETQEGLDLHQLLQTNKAYMDLKQKDKRP